MYCLLYIVFYFFVHTEQKSAQHSVNPAERIQVTLRETGVNKVDFLDY